MAIDSQRARTYAAERRAFEGTLAEAALTFAEVGDLVAEMVATPWWRDHGPSGVTVRRGQGTRIHSGAEIATATITISEVQQTPATVAHELAHLCGGSGHDDVFRGALLALIGALCGPVAQSLLLEEFTSDALDHVPMSPCTTWPRGRLADHPRFA